MDVMAARLEFLEAVPLGISFCQFVLRDGVLLTSNSAHDDRLEGHPYRGVMVAYHGVPIPSPEGGLLGTLCHFDVSSNPSAMPSLKICAASPASSPPFFAEGSRAF